MPTPGQEALTKMRAAAREALETAAFDLAGRAAADAPVESGRLRGSVSPGGDPAHGGSPNAMVVEKGDRMEISVSFSTPYAHAQHEGYIDYGGGTEVEVRAHTRRLPSGKAIRVRAHTQTRRGRVRFRHYPLGGGRKFLERNLKAMAPRYESVIAEKVRRAMQS